MQGMNTVVFDTLKLARGLEEAGFEHNQAIKTAEVLSENMSGSIVTREYLDHKIAELKADIIGTETRILRWLVPLLLGQAALVTALVKLL